MVEIGHLPMCHVLKDPHKHHFMPFDTSQITPVIHTKKHSDTRGSCAQPMLGG